MARHHQELLAAAKLLLAREAGRRGRLSSARIRRSVSTSYYAIFHFVQEECAWLIVGSRSEHLRRRRIFVRTLTHLGMRETFKKVTGPAPSAGASDFLSTAGPAIPTPDFVRAFAAAFIEAQAQRHAADYDLNSDFNEHDARRMIAVVEAAISGWTNAGAIADRDFKHALCLLMALGGKLRAENG